MIAWRKSRKITEKIVVTGNLELKTPAHFGGGDSDGLIDMPLIRDALERKALLTGTSIAGTLRNYLREIQLGYKGVECKNAAAVKLFGAMREDDDGEQSSLIVDDAIGEIPKTEIRDGVKIDPKTRTAAMHEENGKIRGQKFDIELMQSGTTFPMRFELLICEGNDMSTRQELVDALATALQGFEKVEITLGSRKRRGYGRCIVKKWKIEFFDMKNANDLFAWLAADHPEWSLLPEKVCEGENIANLLGATNSILDGREHFIMDAKFSFDGSMIIRSGAGEDDQKPQPDAVHLHSNRGGVMKPILSGTSIGGVIRHRALRIANTLCKDEARVAKVKSLIEDMFGPDMQNMQKSKWASRLTVRETVVENPFSLIQNRIKIDRFTGGAYEAALFNEQPLFAGNVHIELFLRSPESYEIGLLLLVLKDLWTGDLPVGGESSIGRGRLKGIEATLTNITPSQKEIWKIQNQNDGKLIISGEKKNHYEELPKTYLQTEYVDKLLKKLGLEVER